MVEANALIGDAVRVFIMIAQKVVVLVQLPRWLMVEMRWSSEGVGAPKMDTQKWRIVTKPPLALHVAQM